MEFPKTLAERLRTGKVIPFIGAGVSMSVLERKTGKRLFPSWRELLERAAKRLDEERKSTYGTIVRSLLAADEPDYLYVAKQARDHLGSVWFEFLKEQLDHLRERIVDEASLDLARSVWGLGSQLLVTTNYDRVLHWACPQQSDLQSWDIEAPAEQVAAMRDGLRRSTVWHLHGCIDNATGMILTPDGYSRLYPEAGTAETRYQAALKTLHSLLTSRSFLFIGFSLDDAYFGMQLRGLHEIFQGATGPHYVLVRHADRERVQALNLSVDILTFPEFGQPLLDYLHGLTKIIPSTEPLVVTPEAVPTDGSSTYRSAPYDPRNPVFFVPYRPKGDQVIGREAALQAVREQLTRGYRTAIGQTATFQGLGGLGKTQLAVEYAYRYREEYPNGVIWLSADQDIDAQLIELSEKARWIAPQSEHKYKLEVARQRLRSYSQCLIVFDNLEDLQTVADYLPEPQAEPHILVTSRVEQPGFTPVPLDLLNEELSLKLLLQEAGKEPEEEAGWQAAREIAEALGGLPLALELAGAYLRHRSVGWRPYRDLLQYNLKAALPGRFLTGSFTRHEADLYSTLKIDEEVFAEEPRLREILDLLTWSGPAPMGQSLLSALLDVQNPTELTGALSLGVALRLLLKTPETESYAVHRLVREVRRENMPLAEHLDWGNSICQRIGNWFQERRQNFADLPQFEAEIDHLRAWQDHALHHAPQHASRLTWLQAYPHYHRGRYQEAKEGVEKAEELFEQVQPEDSQLKAHVLNDLGTTYFLLGDYQRGLEHYEKALAIQQEVLGERHPDTATSLNNLGSVYGNLGKYEQALEHHKKALAIQQEVLGERHPDTATSLNNLGSVYSSLGKYEQALEHHKKALTIRQEVLGERHPDIAMSFNNLGSVYSSLGKHDHALEYVEQALRLHRELLGDQHPDTVLVAHNLAQALSDLSRQKEALHLVNEFLRKIPQDHPHYALLKHLQPKLLAKALPSGFRQPAKKNPKQKTKTKKNRR